MNQMGQVFSFQLEEAADLSFLVLSTGQFAL